jgi:hypothetical protein
MQRNIFMTPDLPVQLLVNTPSGPLALTAERARIVLPQGPDHNGPKLYYGPYLSALSRFLLSDSHGPLRRSLDKHLERKVAAEEIEALELISEKHGALYHVCRVQVHLEGGNTCNLVMNVAVKPEQHAFLENEFNLLKELHSRFALPHLPRPYLLGETTYMNNGDDSRLLKIFVAEWFEGFHEFHLSQRSQEESPILRIWYLEGMRETLGPEQTRSLYRQAGAILTGYFDERSYCQIHPWHHAAGDFILKPASMDVELKLVTARGHRCLLRLDAGPDDLWIALIHFFLNLTLRLRLDRLEGTGDLAWAPSDCLSPILSGFLEAWSQKCEKAPILPSSADVMEALRSFTPDEWHGLAEVVIEDCQVESDESSFIHCRLDDHLRALQSVLHESAF